MDFNGFRLEYEIEGIYNYIAWKDRMEEVLEENGLKEFIDNDIPKLAASDVALLDVWQKKVANARRILLERVWDHIVSSLYKKLTPYSMWKALTDLFQSISDEEQNATKMNIEDKFREFRLKIIIKIFIPWIQTQSE